MSDKDWYTNLSRYELEGKHVHVLFSDGTMEGSLNLLGQIVYWNSDAGLKHVQILDWNKDRTWTRATGVESVSLVWDERDWEQIRTVDISKADAIVVNGNLYPVTGGVVNHYWFHAESPDHPDGVSIPKPYVSCALRRRHKLPTEPGFYRSDSDDFLYLSDDREWWMFEADNVAHLSLPPTDFLPLTPVHFVDGRAE